jgi:hypothetical protein
MHGIVVRFDEYASGPPGPGQKESHSSEQAGKGCRRDRDDLQQRIGNISASLQIQIGDTDQPDDDAAQHENGSEERYPSGSSPVGQVCQPGLRSPIPTGGGSDSATQGAEYRPPGHTKALLPPCVDSDDQEVASQLVVEELE